MMTNMMDVLIGLDKYLNERATLLLEMEMCEERRTRLNELAKFLNHFYTQLQKAKEKLEKGETP